MQEKLTLYITKKQLTKLQGDAHRQKQGGDRGASVSSIIRGLINDKYKLKPKTPE